MPTKPLTSDQVLDKMAKYCAYQERCIKDVTDKLKTFDIPESDKKEILDYLIENRFVNDERFARSFVRGKINQSGWGVNKIRFNLKRKGIADELISNALSEYDGDLYRQKLEQILKTKKVNATTPFEAKRKLAAYAIQKGFEPSLVWEVLKEIIQ